jgi:hypothetical protein
VRGEIMKKHHKIEKVDFTEDYKLIKIDGKNYKFKLADISKRLFNASSEQRKKYEISPSGYGIHWPLIDEDLSIDNLIGIKHKQFKPKESISA